MMLLQHYCPTDSSLPQYGGSTSKWSRQLQGVGVPTAPAISTERPRVIQEEAEIMNQLEQQS